jgi:hypothetical protein
MGRGGRNDAGHRGGQGSTRHSVRGSRDEPWDLMNPEDDPLRDLRPRDEDPADPAHDEYVWPAFDEADDD